MKRFFLLAFSICVASNFVMAGDSIQNNKKSKDILFEKLDTANQRRIVSRIERKCQLSIYNSLNSSSMFKEKLASLDSLNNYIFKNDTLASLYYFYIAKISSQSDGYLSEYISSEIYHRLKDDSFRLLANLNFLFQRHKKDYTSLREMLLNYLYGEYADEPRKGLGYLSEVEKRFPKGAYANVFEDLRTRYVVLTNG